MSDFRDLVGKTMSSVVVNEKHEVIFTTTDGERYRMYHEQDCCENVVIEDIRGDVRDLEGSPIIMAQEEVSHDGEPEPDSDYSFTWTFYKLATSKGEVVIRWYGSSNGYYSEGVDFCLFSKD